MTRVWVSSILCVVAVAASTAVWWAGVAFPGDPQMLGSIAFTLSGLITATLGAVVSRRASGAVGPLLTVIGVAQIGIAVRGAWYWIGFIRPDLVEPPSTIVLALNSNLAVVCFVLIAVLVAVFPTGRLPSRRWIALITALVASSALFILGGMVDGYPPMAPYEELPPLVPDPTPAQLAFSLATLVLFVSALIATIVAALLRVRRARGAQRAQLTWVLLGSCLFLFFPVVCGTEVLVTGSPQWPSLAVLFLGMISLPVGVTIGMLRYDLFDVDRALGAAVTWALVATGLGLVFALVIAAGGALVGGASPIVAAVATAVCAVLLLPAYRWIHRRVGARLYPARRAALGAILALEQAVATGQGEPEELQTALAKALRDSGVRVGFVLPEEAVPVDLDGRAVDEPHAAEVLAAGEPIGALVIPSASPSLRREVAAASVMLVNVVRLRMHASRSLREVEASRARLVAAEDAARRRFERDLHDGAQQRLVSLGMSLRLAQRRVAGGGSLDVAGLLDEAVAELGTAIAELRRLAHGIRPSVLDDGLAAAVESLARIVPLPVDLDIDDGGAGVPDTVMTTAYYVIAESLANAVKHSDAEAISVRVDRDVDTMRVVVRDDGCGGADPSGAGISGLGDRVAAAGGRLRVLSEHARGTTIEAELPCAS